MSSSKKVDVAQSVLRLLENEKVIVEGGGATGLAAILPGGPMHKEVQGKRVAVPLCGGNIDVTTLGEVIDRGWPRIVDWCVLWLRSRTEPAASPK